MKHKNFKFLAFLAEASAMGMLDRYKKTGGFHQLLTLVETSSPKKREQFLALIQQESPVWEKEIKTKMLTVDRVFSWPAEVRFEVLTRIHPLTLCASLHGRSAEEIEKVLSPLPPITKRKLTDQLGEINPNAGEKFTSEMKLVTEVRSIAASGYIKFEKFDGNLYIEENIEEILQNADGHTAIEASATPAAVTAEASEKAQTRELPPQSSAQQSMAGTHVEQVDVLKKKLHLLNQENSALKHENQVLKDKLLQIRKIA